MDNDSSEGQYYVVIFDEHDGEPRYVTGPSQKKECQRVLEQHNPYEGMRVIVSARVGMAMSHCWAAGLGKSERITLSLESATWEDLLSCSLRPNFWEAMQALQEQYNKAVGIKRAQPEDEEEMSLVEN